MAHAGLREYQTARGDLRRAIFESDVIFTDDTPIPLQVKGNGKLRKARLWVYVRGGTGPPLTTYDFSVDRSKKRPLDFLEGYRGYVHADAYSGYDELFKREGIIEVGSGLVPGASSTRRPHHALKKQRISLPALPDSTTKWRGPVPI